MALGPAYAVARIAAQQFAPVGDLLKSGGERLPGIEVHPPYPHRHGELYKVLENAVPKTIAAFLISTHGGTRLTHNFVTSSATLFDHSNRAARRLLEGEAFTRYEERVQRPFVECHAPSS